MDLDANDVRGFSESDKPPRDVVDPLAANLRRLVAPELVRMDERGERGRAADRGSDRGGGGASSIAGRDHGRGHGHGHGSSPGRGPGSAPAVSSSWSPFARRRRDSGGDKAVSRFESSSIDADTNRRVSASHATSFDAAGARPRAVSDGPRARRRRPRGFLAAWRRCFRGYRRHLLPSIPRDGSPCFSADGFYDWCVEANRVRRDVAAFVRTVAGSSAFLAHAESQIRAANDAEERRRAKDENAAREGNSLGGGDGAASAVAALVFGPRDGRLSSDGDVGNRDSRHRDSDADPDPDRDAPPPDPLLETDHDEETMGWGNAAMGARRLRAGAVVRAVRFGSHVRRGGGDDGGESVPVRFRTTQATDVGVGVGVGVRLGVGVGFTPAVASAGPSAHAAALGSRFGAPPPLPRRTRSRVSPRWNLPGEGRRRRYRRGRIRASHPRGLGERPRVAHRAVDIRGRGEREEDGGTERVVPVAAVVGSHRSSEHVFVVGARSRNRASLVAEGAIRQRRQRRERRGFEPARGTKLAPRFAVWDGDGRGDAPIRGGTRPSPSSFPRVVAQGRGVDVAVEFGGVVVSFTAQERGDETQTRGDATKTTRRSILRLERRVRRGDERARGTIHVRLGVRRMVSRRGRRGPAEGGARRKNAHRS